MRQHGWSKRRTWRKFHLAVDSASGEVQAAILSEAGATDAAMTPARLTQVDQAVDYHRRSLVETAMFRIKTLFSDHLRARLFTTQATQLGCRCRALNLMTHLGMPDSYRVH